MPHRHDYRPYPYTISRTELSFDLAAELTHVRAQLHFVRQDTATPTPMVLDGNEIELISITCTDEHGAAIDISYQSIEQQLHLDNLPESGVLHLHTTCQPQHNTALSGLFVTGAHLMTQCEAEGFRRMVFFPDRPDVLSTYTVTLNADATRYPVLLSNGNLIEQAVLANNQHRAVWHDPHPKPAYLFALVAGQLAHIEERITQNGAEKLLQVYVEAHDLPRAPFALASLKASIFWDEARYGLPLDLERFMIVATHDFNMGAMENKGLNIFNSKFVLADAATATDVDFENIEAVVGHEYFHNWTGNRVTCQDWFQLSLKEGLTVYRDQEFSADQACLGLSDEQAASARAVQRIGNVNALRSAQFTEDAGPMAHPIRPNAYEEINNFYTMTVYEKGAEVVRLYETLLGRDGFHRGMDLYFARHDGQAVTCDDFRAAMADANDTDLTQFARWYEQAGTPRVHVAVAHDAATRRTTLTLTQANPPVGIEARDEVKPPLHIPFVFGLIDPATGAPLSAQVDTSAQMDRQQNNDSDSSLLMHLTESTGRITLHHPDCAGAPILSLNRNFSAPIVVDYAEPMAHLLMRVAHDTDAFNRWDALQTVYLRTLMQLMTDPTATIHSDLLAAVAQLIEDEGLSPAYRAQMLTIPNYAIVAQMQHSDNAISPLAICAAREQLASAIAAHMAERAPRLYAQHHSSAPYAYTSGAAGSRTLTNTLLRYRAIHDAAGAQADVLALYHQADNMTHRLAALSIAIEYLGAAADALITDFYARFADQPLVIDKWFAAQAMHSHIAPEAYRAHIAALLGHADFVATNPNRYRSLVFTACANPRQFHALDGWGYRFWAEQVVQLDGKNPQVAARLARLCEHWRHHASPHRELMQAAYGQIAAAPLSHDTHEVVHKALQLH